ncbi:MAG: hypothetical protein RIG68_09370 [Imperialibacter sp.]|uniref:hypothetical protein n=1 Tax=Imperialibacter sp. TaxID=2038411 RepID=UPI0032ECBC95
MKNLLLPPIFVFVLSFSSDVSACERYMTPWESGTYRIIEPELRNLRALKNNAERAMGTTNGHRRANANHDHSYEMWNTLYRLGNYAIGMYSGTARTKLSPPQSMAEIVSANSLLRDIVRTVEAKVGIERNWSNLTSDDWKTLLSAIGGLLDEEMAFKNSYCSRQSSSSGTFSYDFTLEHNKLPFVLSFIDGSVTVRAKVKVGDFTTSIKGKYHPGGSDLPGVEYLIIISEDNVAYAYDIRATDLSLDVVNSRLQVKGKTITLTAVKNSDASQL